MTDILRKIIKKLLRFSAIIGLGTLLLSMVPVLIYKWLPVPTTPLMLIRDTDKNQNKHQHNWEPIENISKYLQLAVICSEDQKFLSHFGFDADAIESALESNKRGKKLRGGSSISQQTAKNVFLWPSRTWIRKGLEVYFTLLIEIFWSKERILEVYLNSIEMGEGVYGAEAAAQHWFGKSASELDRNEAAAIAAILPSPRRYKANPQTEYIQSRAGWIANQMRQFGELNL